MADESKKDAPTVAAVGTRLAGIAVAVLLEFNVEDLELMYPLLRLREEGADAFALGPRHGKFTGKHGYPKAADRVIDDVGAADVDCVIVPGGWAPDYWRRDPRFTGLIKDCVESGKVVAAICHGAWLLVSAKVLAGKRVTSFCSIKDDVTNAGAEFVDAEVVIDGNMITSRTPDDLPAFMRAIIASLETAKQAKQGAVAAKATTD